MATQEPNQLAEVLIAFSSFGIRGAHYKELRVVSDPFTGQMTEHIGPPTPIFGAAILQQYLGTALTQALAHNSTLQADLTTANAEAGTTQSALESAQGQLADMQDTITELQADLAAAQAQLAEQVPAESAESEPLPA